MKNKNALRDFESLQKKMNKDKDPFLFVHFSREEDYFTGVTSNDMDIADALIVVNHLINRFEINTKALAYMHHKKKLF